MKGTSRVNFKQEEALVPLILKQAYSQVIIPYLNEGVYENFDKNTNDVVTACDLAVEEFIIKKLKEHFPEDAIISEEFNADKTLQQRTWIIDPIDGTVNFAKHIHLFGLQIALVQGGRPVFASIYLPYGDELYVAVEGQGATVNGQALKVSQVKSLRESLVTFGDFTTKEGRDETRAKQIGTMSNLFPYIRKVKMFGASSIDFVYLASGKTEAMIMFTRNLWDILPGYLIAKESGAVSHYDLSQDSDHIIMACQPEVLVGIHDKVVTS